jgi:hypothetical protein
MIQRKVSTADTLPVMLRDSSGVPVTGKVFGDITCKYQKHGETGLTSKTIDGTNWTEIGQGKYEIDFTAGELDTLKDFTYLVTEAGSIQFNGLVEIVSDTNTDLGGKIDVIDANITSLLAKNQFKVDEFQTYTYDGNGRVSTITVKLSDPIIPTETWTYSFTYDGSGNVLTFNAEKV